MKIQLEELKAELVLALKDYFVAFVTEEDKIVLNFASGQKFSITVEEEK